MKNIISFVLPVSLILTDQGPRTDIIIFLGDINRFGQQITLIWWRAVLVLDL